MNKEEVKYSKQYLDLKTAKELIDRALIHYAFGDFDVCERLVTEAAVLMVLYQSKCVGVCNEAKESKAKGTKEAVEHSA
jgi:hypothetical protein